MIEMPSTLQTALFLPLRANWKRSRPTHTATDRAREKPQEEWVDRYWRDAWGDEIPLLLSSYPSENLQTCRLPSHSTCLSFTLSQFFLFVLWITDVLKKSHFDARPPQWSGNDTVKSFFCFRKREKTEGGWKRRKERSACRLASGLLFPAGFAMVLGPKLPIKRGTCVCSWVCGWHSEPPVTTVLHWGSERIGSWAYMPSDQTHIHNDTYCTLTHIPKIPLWFTHTNYLPLSMCFEDRCFPNALVYLNY